MRNRQKHAELLISCAARKRSRGDLTIMSLCNLGPGDDLLLKLFPSCCVEPSNTIELYL